MLQNCACLSLETGATVAGGISLLVSVAFTTLFTVDLVVDRTKVTRLKLVDRVTSSFQVSRTRLRERLDSGAGEVCGEWDECVDTVHESNEPALDVAADFAARFAKEADSRIRKVMFAVYVFGIVINVIFFFISCIFLIGLYVGDPRLCMPWVVGVGVYAALLVPVFGAYATMAAMTGDASPDLWIAVGATVVGFVIVVVGFAIYCVFCFLVMDTAKNMAPDGQKPMRNMQLVISTRV